MNRIASLRTGSLLLTFLLGSGLSISGGGIAATAYAQARGPVQRLVHGRVVDKEGNGLKGAVVYLQDDHTTAVKSAIAGDDGSYRFVQLTASTDYTLWAKADGKKSASKAISSFDQRNDFTITLKIE